MRFRTRDERSFGSRTRTCDWRKLTMTFRARARLYFFTNAVFSSIATVFHKNITPFCNRFMIVYVI